MFRQEMSTPDSNSVYILVTNTVDVKQPSPSSIYYPKALILVKYALSRQLGLWFQPNIVYKNSRMLTFGCALAPLAPPMTTAASPSSLDTLTLTV